ncbi:MAG: DUF2095 domain-containing protein [Candidatus Caldarchaeum sp.]|nr:DUF2095 domain-containing protein [Candidatus Caldarchaeum sp.]MDW7978333.1 DUF2095 family protein [Candidatus Caldarchaeum sp.]MDW8359416.1 DUF2095 family protein [Candidatus Caldarchaeum sp.]
MKMEMDVEEFRKKFPALYRELVGKKSLVGVDGVRSSSNHAENDAVSKTPTVIDYLRRCDTAKQAEEVVSFLLARGELTEDYAENLLKQLRERGVRSFGTRKQPGHYFREGV